LLDHFKQYTPEWASEITDVPAATIRRIAKEHACGTLVDIGCGTKPYQSIFELYVHRYIGIDLKKSKKRKLYADIVADAYHTSMKDASCELVLCSEVLEHLEDPGKALTEIYRILKEDGIAIVTTPFFWHIHEPPRDFYRFSEYGLQYLFREARFEIIEITPLTGFCVTFTQLLVYFLMRFQKGVLLRTVGRPLNWGMQHLALWLNNYDRSSEFTNLYGVVARKRAVP